MLDIAALAGTPVNPDPFPHVVVPGFVPPEMLGRVVAGLPEMSSGGSHPIESLRLGADAAAMMQEMAAPPLRHAIAAKFGLDLDDAPTMVTLRGQSREKDGRIHRDSDAKRVTVLLYLNPENAAWARQDGCLRLLRGPDHIDDFATEVPPVNGTLLVFPNGPATWHGHKPFVGRRYVVQLNYMTTDGKARSELRRHKVSALVKRLTHAA